MRARYQHEGLGHASPEYKLRGETNRAEDVLIAGTDWHVVEVIDETRYVLREDLPIKDNASRLIIHPITAEYHQRPAITGEILIIQFLVQLRDQKLHAAVQFHVMIARLRLDDEHYIGRMRYRVALQSLKVTFGHLRTVYHGARGTPVRYS